MLENKYFGHKQHMIPTNKMTTTLINIDNYNNKFEEYPSDLIVFAKEKNLTLLPLKSMRGQVLALMSQPEVRGSGQLYTCL